MLFTISNPQNVVNLVGVSAEGMHSGKAFDVDCSVAIWEPVKEAKPASTTPGNGAATKGAAFGNEQEDQTPAWARSLENMMESVCSKLSNAHAGAPASEAAHPEGMTVDSLAETSRDIVERDSLEIGRRQRRTLRPGPRRKAAS